MDTPVPVASYVGALAGVEGRFLTTEQAQACRGAFEDLTLNYGVYAGQNQGIEALGASLRSQFAGVGIAGGQDVGMAPLVEGASCNVPDFSQGATRGSGINV